MKTNAEEKCCLACGLSKPLTEFYRKKERLRARCKECIKLENRNRWDSNAERYRATHREWTRNNKEHKAQQDKEYKLKLATEDKARAMLYSTRYNSKKRGLEFSLTLKDIVIPDTCPLLGIRLKKGQGKICPASPTLDRIDSTKGYVPGNVWVISHRANCIKNDSTPDELIHIGKLLASMFPQLVNAANQIQNKPSQETI